MRNSQADVELTSYPEANHFLFFSHRDRFLKQLSNWLAKQDIFPPSAIPPQNK
jgi:hypothetical protein